MNYKITPTPGGGGDVIKLREIESLFFPQTAVLPHPALSKGEGLTDCAAQVLSFGEDLGEAKHNAFLNLMTLAVMISPPFKGLGAGALFRWVVNRSCKNDQPLFISRITKKNGRLIITSCI